MRSRLQARFCFLLLTLLSAGCQTTRTALGSEHSAFLARLKIAAKPAERPRYAAIEGCTYRAAWVEATGERRGSTFDLSLKAIRDRLLVRIAEGQANSTALIGHDGRLFDFNYATWTQPANSDNFALFARQRATALQPVHGAESHVVNELALFFPYYSGAMKPGETVSTILDERNQPWARYVYRGTATHQGRAVFVLELLRRSDAQPQAGERTIGYNLVDPEHALPLLVVVESISKIRLEQVRCR